MTSKYGQNAPNRLIFPQTIIIMKVGDGNAAFGLASNRKLPGLVVPARGITPARIVLRVTEVHKPPHHDKVATTEEVSFLHGCLAFSLPHGSPHVSSCLVLCLLLSLGHSHLINLTSGSWYI